MKPCWPVFAVVGIKRVCCAGVSVSHLAGLQELRFPFIPLQGSVVIQARDDGCTRIQMFNLELVSRWQSYTERALKAVSITATHPRGTVGLTACVVPWGFFKWFSGKAASLLPGDCSHTPTLLQSRHFPC